MSLDLLTRIDRGRRSWRARLRPSIVIGDAATTPSTRPAVSNGDGRRSCGPECRRARAVQGSSASKRPVTTPPAERYGRRTMTSSLD